MGGDGTQLSLEYLVSQKQKPWTPSHASLKTGL